MSHSAMSEMAEVLLEGDLMVKAWAYTGIEDTADLVRAALVALIEHESARRLAPLGRQRARREACTASSHASPRRSPASAG